MQAAWMVRARQMEGRFAFWLVIIGYNKRDRSLSHRIYLAYALLFLCFWVFAVFSLLAGTGANLLRAIDPENPAFAAQRLAFLVLVAWGFISLIRYSRRSPFLFTEDDAFLICQTPIDRRAVILTWFPADWLENALPFWALIVTLGFSLAEIGIKGQASVTDIPSYVLMGVRALILFLPLQMGILAVLWAVGAIRLQSDEEHTWVRWTAWILTIALFGGMLLDLLKQGLVGDLNLIWRVIYWPIEFPIMAAFGLNSWRFGLVLGIAWAVVGLVLLVLLSKNLNLSRAAQESRIQSAQLQATRSGSYDHAKSVAQKERLGMGHPPSQIPAKPGIWALVWKDIVQSLRDSHLASIFPWLKIFIAALGIVLLPGWPARGLAMVIWCIFTGQAGTARLRNDLGRWSILRQLPFTPANLLIVDLLLPWCLSLLVTDLALVIGFNQPEAIGILFLVLAPPAIASIILLAAYDILRQSPMTALMVGVTGELNARGAFIALIAVALPLGLVFWLAGGGIPLVLCMFLGFAASCFIAWIAWQVSAHTLKQIE